MTHDTEHTPPTNNKPKSGWVLRCTDDSIAARQISITAILETVAAVGAYWWLALQFEWPLMAFVSMVAAPILLMRSEESIALGVKLLRKYWKSDAKEMSRRVKIIIFLVTALVTGIASYFLVAYWLTDYISWSLFWRAAVLGVVAVIFTTMVTFSVTVAFLAIGNQPADMGTNAAVSVVFISFTIMATIMGTIKGASAIAIAVVGVSMGICVGVIAGSRFLVTVYILYFPCMPIGILIRGFIIRLYATLRHPLAGLAQLPLNWRETLLVIDCTHPPELLPQAGTIEPELSVKGIWVNRHNIKGNEHLLAPMFLFAWYLPALIYRWSLKASAWLWFPLSLALTPPLHQKEAQDSRRWMAILHAWHWSYWVIATMGILWLLSATPWLETWLPLLPTEYATIHANLPAPPAFGLRYALACFGCLLIVLLVVKSKNLKASHGKVFDSSNDFDGLSLENKNKFLSIAKSIDRIRLLLIAVLFLWGEMMALGFYHAHYPDVVERFISPALMFYL